MKKFLLMSKVTLFCLLCSFSLKSFGQALASSYAMRAKDKSQVESKSVSLKEALKDLEMKHKIVFSYESKLIENKFVELKKANSANIENELESLLQPLNLLGKKLDEKLYVIVPAHSKQINHLNKFEGTGSVTNENMFAQANMESMISRAAISTSVVADVPVKGKVTGDVGEALPGVSVVVKGTTIGTVTDADGNFSLNVPNENSVLSFSFIGYLSQDITVGSKTTINVTLPLDVKSLSEVVVTGYQTQSRREITGAVSSVAAKDLVSIPQSSVEQQLQGRVAGVSVITSGQPGTQSQVRIRGFGSFNQSTPLYVVDGIPTFDISFINPNDIETTTVLKDAATASQYGARASSGVILLSTKKGKAGHNGIHVTYDGSYGVQNPGKGYEYLSPTETMEATRLSLVNAGKEVKHDQYGTGTFSLPDYLLVGSTNGVRGEVSQADLAKYNINFDKGNVYQIVRANKGGTDWFKELTDPAPIQNHTLGVSGSNENSRYYIGASYFNQQGVVNNTYMKRYTLRANTEFNVKNRVRIGENFQVSLIEDPDFTSINGFGTRRTFNNLNEGNSLSHAYRMNPLVPVYDVNGGYAGTAAKGFNNPKNPVAIQDRAEFNKGNNVGLFGNIYAEIDVLKDLTFRTSFGGRYINLYGTSYQEREYENSENINTFTFFETSGWGFGWTFTNTLSYVKELGLSKINVLGGVESIRDNVGRFLTGSGNDPLTSDPDYRTIGSTLANGRLVNSAASNPTKLYSLFGKVDYIYNQKYMLSATVRRDASSNFSSDERVGIFPAFSAGWIISEESFLQNVGFLNSLKIRGSWGMMGNQGIDLRNQFNLFSTNPSFNSYAINGSNGSTTSGIAQATIENANTKWETNKTFNIGFDGNFLNNTLDIIFDYYVKNTSDLLFNPALPSTLGVSVASPFVNIGEISNRGVDFQIIKRGKIGSDWRYEADLTLTTYKNKIEKVADGVEYFNTQGAQGSTRIGTPTRNQVGQSISAFFGYQVEGIFQSAEDVSSHATQPDAAPGRFKFKDVVDDGVIDEKDRTFIGNPNPDFTYGLTLKVGYKGLDLESTFFGSQGGDIFNYTRWFTDFYPSFPGQALSKRALHDSWSETNKGGTTPRLEDASNFSTNQQINSYYVEDGSYLRNRNLKLSYTLPERLVNKVSADRFTIFVQGTNLFTATKYSGLDPGVSGVDTNFGIDYGNYPVVKQYLLGVNIGF